MFEDNQSGIAPRVDVEALFDQVISESQDINLNQRYTCIVKVGNIYAAKNNAEGIKQGKRYVLSDKPFHFYKESEAYDAARVMKGNVVKEA